MRSINANAWMIGITTDNRLIEIPEKNIAPVFCGLRLKQMIYLRPIELELEDYKDLTNFITMYYLTYEDFYITDHTNSNTPIVELIQKMRIKQNE